MSAHTPGPWAIHPAYVDNKPYAVNTEDGKCWLHFDLPISGGTDDRILCTVTMSPALGGYYQVQSANEARANAQLIIAAPALLAAARKARRFLAQSSILDEGYAETYDALDAAIKGATS